MHVYHELNVTHSENNFSMVRRCGVSTYCHASMQYKCHAHKHRQAGSQGRAPRRSLEADLVSIFEGDLGVDEQLIPICIQFVFLMS